MLSEYLARGDLQGLRAAAAVNASLFLSVPSYAGYYTVNATAGALTFVWYFPAMDGNASAPLLIWLQGGPGATSLYGLFGELGPFTVAANGSLLPNPYTWCAHYQCVFIDNPPGTGFSQVNPGDYCTDWTCYGSYLDSVLRQLISSFPELNNTPVWIFGESYAGKYVPAFAYTVHTNNAAGAQPHVNLAGFGIGDGWTDPRGMVRAYPDMFYNMGLCDEPQRLEAADIVFQIERALDAGDYMGAFKAWNDLINGDLINYPPWFTNITGLTDYFNLNRDSEPPSYFWGFISRQDIKNAIHVGNATFNGGGPVEAALYGDIMFSQAMNVAALLNAGYRALIYSGQMDIIVGAPLTETYLFNLPWNGLRDYQRAARTIWHVDGLVGGYVRNAANLWQVVVRGAGHMVPADQPARALDMLTRFIENQPWA